MLKEKILKTIIFYDIFDFPLSLFEIRKDLGEIKLSDLNLILEELIIEKKLELKNGFYFLAGREEIIKIRSRRYNYSKRKIKIALRFARIFMKIPFVSSVYLANSIGDYNLRDESDIDFFVTTRTKRIWLSRLLSAGLAKILNKRPNKKTKRDKICLSFYLSEENLDFNGLKLKDGDPYFDFWEKNLLLLKERRGREKRFSRTLNFLETLSYKFQLKIMPEKLRLANNISGVIFGEDIIKLYLKDRRLEIKEKYERKIHQIFGTSN